MMRGWVGSLISLVHTWFYYIFYLPVCFPAVSSTLSWLPLTYVCHAYCSPTHLIVNFCIITRMRKQYRPGSYSWIKPGNEAKVWLCVKTNNRTTHWNSTESRGLWTTNIPYCPQQRVALHISNNNSKTLTSWLAYLELARTNISYRGIRK